jgi:2-hydroxy-6-oxonona-2,4-dienedioate hydrolase
MSATVAPLTEEGTSKLAPVAGGYQVHYNEAGTGHPVLFLHGVGPGATSWSNFSPNFQVLAQQFRCLLVDAPGWGKSDPIVLSEARLNVNARALLDLMDALEIEKASLIGNSMGGRSALVFAIDHPDRVEKVIAMGAGAGVPGPLTPIPTEGIRIIGETYRNPTVENFRRLVQIMVYDSSFVTDELLEQRRQGALRNQEHIDNWVKSSQVPDRDFYGDLPKIMAPTLLIHGRNDRTVTLESGLMAFARIPGARMHIFNECAHWAQLEKVDEFNRLVVDFLRH